MVEGRITQDHRAGVPVIEMNGSLRLVSVVAQQRPAARHAKEGVAG